MQTLHVTATVQSGDDEEFDRAVKWLGSVVSDIVPGSVWHDWTATALWDLSEWWNVTVSVKFPDWDRLHEGAVASRRANLCGCIFFTLYPGATVHGFEWGHIEETDQ